MAALAELEIFLRFDPYREPPGTDAGGRNIFKVSLHRLEALDELVGPEYDDILAFARAQCLERLGRWTEAETTFHQAAQAQTTLRDEALSREAWAGKIRNLLTPPREPTTIEEHADRYRAIALNLRRFIESAPPFPYRSFALVEAERNTLQQAEFWFSLRRIAPEATREALDAAGRLTTENTSSHNAGANLLVAARYNEQLAFDYCATHDPTGPNFELERWSEFVRAAREACERASQMDGDAAKPEAAARLRALDAYAQRIGALAQ